MVCLARGILGGVGVLAVTIAIFVGEASLCLSLEGRSGFAEVEPCG